MNVSVLLDLTCHPNSKRCVFNLCKVAISKSKINEEELIKAMETINDEKRDVNLFFNGIIPLKNF